MSTIGKRFFEISRGYETISDNYKRPYIVGVDIKDEDKPFILASGDNHSDFGATVLSLNDVLSGKWDEHIVMAQSLDFFKKLKTTLDNGETFPPRFLVAMIAD